MPRWSSKAPQCCRLCFSLKVDATEDLLPEHQKWARPLCSLPSRPPHFPTCRLRLNEVATSAEAGKYLPGREKSSVLADSWWTILNGAKLRGCSLRGFVA